MKQIPIWTNPSHQRSLIQPAIVGNEIKDFLELTICSTYINKKVSVFPDMEYTVTFYDGQYGTKRTLTGLVTAVYKDQIKLKCLNGRKDLIDCSACPKRDTCEVAQKNLPPMPVCNCILNPPDVSKYDDPKEYFIPVQNIMNIIYGDGNVQPPKPPKKDGVKVVLLGISATIVKAIVINLAFFDDNAEEATKYVELETGKIYDLTYDIRGTLYESRVKVLNIEECQPGDFLDEPKDPIVRENIGMNNSVYGEVVPPTKDEFFNAPPAKKIRITIDTSETFDGNIECIMLDSIRDCTLVEDEQVTEETEELPIE